MNFVRFFGFILSMLLLFGFQATPVKQVAIFDFDDRTPFPDALSMHIEERIRALSEGIAVSHYSGKSDEIYSTDVLSTLDNRGLDLLIIRTSDALIIAQHTLFKTPTLYTNVNNPKILGFRTLGPPGGNISGASYYIPIKKHISLYKILQPALKRPGFVFDKNNQSRKAEVPEAREACAELGLGFDAEFIDKKVQLREMVQMLVSRGADAIVVATSGLLYENIDHFLDITDNAGIPVYSFYKAGVRKGAVAAMSSDYFQMVDELLIPMAKQVLFHKISPGDMPVAFQKNSKVFINERQAKNLHIEIPEKIIMEDSEVIVELSMQ
ncbi:MAG: hypothetical protein HKM93_19430 [Desulfobacteraceae bacterium]|nr:hypothetical protein [Desulfobacteraceae bacterium]